MAKQRTSEQEAIRVAQCKPEKHFHCSRVQCWANGKRPFNWGFSTNWNNISISIGEVKSEVHKKCGPEHILDLVFMAKPFMVACFWKGKRLFWIGDWARKRDLIKL